MNRGRGQKFKYNNSSHQIPLLHGLAATSGYFYRPMILSHICSNDVSLWVNTFGRAISTAAVLWLLLLPLLWLPHRHSFTSNHRHTDVMPIIVNIVTMICTRRRFHRWVIHSGYFAFYLCAILPFFRSHDSATKWESEREQNQLWKKCVDLNIDVVALSLSRSLAVVRVRCCRFHFT